MIEIDGNHGEGGGQVIRTALAFSMLTQQPFKARNIRKGRPEPGLKAQHLHGIKSLQKLSQCQAKGAELGSTELEFHPAPLKASSITIKIGTAGSTTLLLQSILLPCLFAGKPITLTIKGGTDTKWATPLDHFRYVLLPQLQRFAKVELKLLKRGYYPRGDGQIEISIGPKLHRGEEDFASFLTKVKANAEPYALEKQGIIGKINGIAHASIDLKNSSVAERMAQGAHQILAKRFHDISIKKEYHDTASPGAGIALWAQAGEGIIGADALGERSLRAEDVGRKAAEHFLEEAQEGAAVDRHTLDQLLPFLSLAGGIIRTSTLTPHALTNIHTIEAFLGKRFSVNKEKATITCA